MKWVKRLFTRQTTYQDLAEEIQQHLLEKTETLMSQGSSREEAE